jgi:hypothetical protein
MTLDPTRLQAGDAARHGPSGETWYILGVDSLRGKVCVAGWPATMAELADCTLIEKGKGITLYEHRYRRTTFGGGWDGELL